MHEDVAVMRYDYSSVFPYRRRQQLPGSLAQGPAEDRQVGGFPLG